VRQLRLGDVERFLGPFAIADVAVDLQDRDRVTPPVSLKGPAAGDDDGDPIAPDVRELPFPSPGLPCG